MELDKLLARLLRRKEELLKVLERPEIPLHTNASENDLRSCVTKRKISGGTMSNDGRIARDTMLGLMKTCKSFGFPSGIISATGLVYPVNKQPFRSLQASLSPKPDPTYFRLSGFENGTTRPALVGASSII